MYTSAKPYFYGTGRRKKSVARVRLLPGSGNIEKLYLYPPTDAGDENLITNAMAGKIDYAFCKDSSQVQQLMNMDGYTVETVNVTFPRYIFINMFEK